MTRRWFTAALVAAMFPVVSSSGAAQDAPASAGSALSITSPAENAYITGSVLLQARVDPASAVRQMTFFADGRSVCVVVQPPFDCAWDAGGGLREHVIRVVATLADGRRLVATRRTRDA